MDEHKVTFEEEDKHLQQFPINAIINYIQYLCNSNQHKSGNFAFILFFKFVAFMVIELIVKSIQKLNFSNLSIINYDLWED